MPAVILSTAYLPPVAYFKKIKDAASVYIEKHEHYLKQSYRNRCNIFGANGVLSLSIPVINKHDKEIITDTKISYVEKWQQQHWRTIESAYRNSPYFIYYADALKPFYQKKYTFLFDFNTELLQLLINNFKLNAEIKFSEAFEKSNSLEDFRYSIHPKNEIVAIEFKPYSQLFNEKFPFVPNLSSIDLLFNAGPHAKDYL
ncbi:MAG TPA: WbqC family protein [Bacteroidia bacterium]|jgi:hypothetical protein|nr:WbqC family protein [Bacteroidia bacterium]